MGCCSATWFLVCLGFSAIYTFMIVYGATRSDLDRDTANGLVAAGSVCLAWSLFYLVMAFVVLAGGPGPDLTCRTKQSGWFVSIVLVGCLIAIIVSIVLIPVGATKGNTGLWAAGLANLLYAIMTGAWVFVASCFCAVITHSNH